MKPMHTRLVAAVRWDYEIGLMSCADIARKYHQVMHHSTVYNICSRDIYPHVAPVRHALAWAKQSWRAKA